MTGPVTVCVVLPVLDGADLIEACLDSVAGQTYGHVTEVLVVDGGSADGTQALAAARPGVTVLHNRDRRQAAAMNIALRSTSADVVVRIDARVRFDPTYVERAVEALDRTGAAIVGGAQVAVGRGWPAGGIALAFASRLGAGPAAFRRPGVSGWVDTAYLGAFRVDTARLVGGYDESLAVNEDADFARRIGQHGGVWLAGDLRSTYVVRARFADLARQYRSYGRGRGEAMATGRSAVGFRQLLAPALVLGLLSPWRRPVGLAYAAAVGVAVRRTEDRSDRLAMALALPVMHLSWAVGFFDGVVAGRRSGAHGR